MGFPRYVGLRISTVAGAVPTAADVGEGELAINVVDGRIYTLFGSTVNDITDRYTRAETDSLLSGKADALHSHTLSEITDAGSAAAEDATAFDPAGTAAQVGHSIRETLRQRPDPLLMHFL